MLDVTPDDALRKGLVELAGMLIGDTPMEHLLGSVTTLAAMSIPGCDSASISLLRNGRAETPVCSGPLALSVDRSQYDTGEGPCLTAIDTAAIICVESFVEDRRWPAFSAQAVAKGVESTLAIPLAAGGTVIGALNLYSERRGGFAGQEEQAAVFARQASVTLANGHAVRRAEELARQLERALETRDVIGQAKGIIMATQSVDSDTAFDILRRASQRANRKLHELAREIVERRNLPPAEG